MVDLAGNGGWECECECVLCTVYCLYWKLIFVTLLSKESFLCGCFSCSLHSKAKDQGKRGTCTDIDYRYNQRHPKTYIVWERKRGGERERERERECIVGGFKRGNMSKFVPTPLFFASSSCLSRSQRSLSFFFFFSSLFIFTYYLVSPLSFSLICIICYNSLCFWFLPFFLSLANVFFSPLSLM